MNQKLLPSKMPLAKRVQLGVKVGTLMQYVGGASDVFTVTANAYSWAFQKT